MSHRDRRALFVPPRRASVPAVAATAPEPAIHPLLLAAMAFAPITMIANSMRRIEMMQMSEQAQHFLHRGE